MRNQTKHHHGLSSAAGESSSLALGEGVDDDDDDTEKDEEAPLLPSPRGRLRLTRAFFGPPKFQREFNACCALEIVAVAMGFDVRQ